MILKIPLILGKEKKIVPTCLYKSENFNDYTNAFERAYNALIKVIKAKLIIDDSFLNENRNLFLSFVELHYPKSKVEAIAKDLGQKGQDLVLTQQRLNARVKTS